MKLKLICLFCFLFPALLLGSIIIVPIEYETIQGAIDASEDNDTLFVLPGEYVENINFSGKAIKLFASGGIAPTVIDGGGEGPCVVFTNGEGIRSVLAGFILTNGVATGDRYGGGILIEGASPLVLMNAIVNNSAAEGGGGISASGGGASVIARNLIYENISEAIGGGISLYQCSGVIINNTIVGNVSAGDGSAVNMPFTSGVQLFNNIMVANEAGNGSAISGWQAQELNNSYNDVWFNEGGNYAENIQAGEGSISQNPQFVGAGEGDFHLTENSPCIDTGDPNTLDPDSSRADMGAFPFTQMENVEPITILEDSVSFGSIGVDTVSVIVLTLSNPNQSDITVIPSLIDGIKFTASDSIIVVEAEGEAELTITFSPDGEAGEWSDSLRMISISSVDIELLESTITIPRPIGYEAINIMGESEVFDYVDQKDNLPDNFDVIKAFPNPFNSSIEIQIRAKSIERAEVSIWNANGRLIETIHNGLLKSGESAWIWSAERQTAGTYFVRFKSATQNLERKIQYLK